MKTAAGAIVFSEGRLLILKPSYLDYWLLPGGHTEAGESPRETCMREIEEEIGFPLEVNRLLCIDFWRQGLRVEKGNRVFEQKEDALVFLFWGGHLTPVQRDQIRLPAEEVVAHQFLPLEEALSLLALYYEGRIRYSLEALEKGQTAYLEGGRPVS